MKEDLRFTQESSFPCMEVDSEGGNMMVWSEDSHLEKTKEKLNETQQDETKRNEMNHNLSPEVDHGIENYWEKNRFKINNYNHDQHKVNKG